MEVAVGFVPHSGWAVGVVAGFADGGLRVCDRRRVELVSSDLPRQAYHAAADLPLDEARRLVDSVDASIADRSFDALAAIRTALRDQVLVAVGVVGATRTIPDVSTVLASHASMHASEGEQYRRGIASAAARLGLPVWRVDAQKLEGHVAQLLGWSASRLAEEHRRVRAALGPPWQKDHRHAAEVALVVLHRGDERLGDG